MNILKQARQKAGLTQQQAAKALGYKTPQFISNWERDISTPPVESIKTIAKLYKIEANDLFEYVLGTEIHLFRAKKIKRFARSKAVNITFQK